MVYIPGVATGINEVDANKVAKFVMDELRAISREFQQQDWVRFKVWHEVPPKPREGLVAYADGSDWNPGSGVGMYRFNGTIWVFLG